MNALLDKREVRIRRMFNDIAPTYDLLNHLLSLNIDQSWRRTTAKAMQMTHGPVLDLCTGTGDLAFAFDTLHAGKLAITGADFSHEMLVRAVRKGDKRKTAERICFVEADAQALPFADAAFEGVTISFGLRNVTDMHKGLAEMVRVLQPGGRLGVLEFSRPRHWFFGRMYRWYFRYLLPLIGHVFTRNKDSAYTYLPESVLTFPDGEEMAATLTQHGLTNVSFRPLTFGIATLYLGTKPTP